MANVSRDHNQVRGKSPARLDVGEDTGTPVNLGDDVTLKFMGKLNTLVIELRRPAWAPRRAGSTPDPIRPRGTPAWGLSG
jgi:hypothetical protein